MLFFLPLPTTMATSSLLFLEFVPLLLAEDISSIPELVMELVLMAAPRADVGLTMALPDVTT